MKNKYSELTDENKTLFKEICEHTFGTTISFSEDRQPLYFTDDGNMIDPDYMVLEFIT